MKLRPARFAFSLAVLAVHLLTQWPASVAAAVGPRRLNDPAMDMWATGSRWPIIHALANPAVQLAVRDFESRGYVRVPTYDACRANGDTSVVLIAFQQPGVDMTASMPVIAVFNSPGSSGPSIDVMGGIVVRNPDGTFSGTSTPDAPAIRVTDGSGMSTGATPLVVQTNPWTNRQWSDFIHCVFFECVACSAIPLPVIAQIICCIVIAFDCHQKVAVP